jgi:hypothetical protein
MGRSRGWIACIAFVPLVLTGLGCSSGDDDHPKSAPNSSVRTTAPGTQNAASSASAQTPSLDQMAEMLTKQLEQATNGNGGPPRAISREEVEALMRSQTEQMLNQMKRP